MVGWFPIPLRFRQPHYFTHRDQVSFLPIRTKVGTEVPTSNHVCCREQRKHMVYEWSGVSANEYPPLLFCCRRGASPVPPHFLPSFVPGRHFISLNSIVSCARLGFIWNAPKHRTQSSTTTLHTCVRFGSRTSGPHNTKNRRRGKLCTHRHNKRFLERQHRLLFNCWY